MCDLAWRYLPCRLEEVASYSLALFAKQDRGGKKKTTFSLAGSFKVEAGS